jgi:tyrosine-protein kinase Etk/Wzc
VIPTEIPGLDVLPSGPIPPNPSELLDSARFAELLAEMGEAYEHVVIDSPPALAVADALAMAAQVDAIVLVARAESTPMPSLLHAVERFRLTGLRPVGIVLNDVVPDLDSGGSGRYRYAYGSEHQGSDDDRSRQSESA